MGAAFLLPQPQPQPQPLPFQFVFQDGYEPPRGDKSRGRSQIGLLFHTIEFLMMTTLLLPYPYVDAEWRPSLRRWKHYGTTDIRTDRRWPVLRRPG